MPHSTPRHSFRQPSLVHGCGSGLSAFLVNGLVLVFLGSFSLDALLCRVCVCAFFCGVHVFLMVFDLFVFFGVFHFFRCFLDALSNKASR